MWHWMMLEIQLCITEINYILKYIFIENSYFNITSLYCVFDQINGDLDVSNVYNVERKLIVSSL